MTKSEWDAFQKFRAAFKRKIAVWKAMYPELDFVYNSDLDTIIAPTDIRYIFVGDNPGKDEKAQGRYFAGRTGKMCDKFMKKIGIDRANVLVLNKTPIHTPSTMDLNDVKRVNPIALIDTQTWMAEQIVRLTKVFTDVDLCIFGISQLKKGKLFEPFCEVLKTGLDPIYAAEHLDAFKHCSYGHLYNDYITVVKQGAPYSIPNSIIEKIDDEYGSSVDDESILSEDIDGSMNNPENILDILRSIGKFHSRNIFGM
ncbi:MAG: uracil-DNA glycosylase family protein [Bacteroidales bacterium]